MKIIIKESQYFRLIKESNPKTTIPIALGGVIDNRINYEFNSLFGKLSANQSDLSKSFFNIDKKRDEIKSKLSTKLKPFFISEYTKAFKDPNYYINVSEYNKILTSIINEMFSDMWDATKWGIKKAANREYGKDKNKFLEKVKDSRDMISSYLSDLLTDIDSDLSDYIEQKKIYETPVNRKKEYGNFIFIKETPETLWKMFDTTFSNFFKTITGITIS